VKAPHFLDLDERVVARETHRSGKVPKAGGGGAILKPLERKRQAKIAAARATSDA
jgi:hypothetical protein